MSSRRSPVLPPRLEAGLKQFEHWRSTRSSRSRIPESLWGTAVELGAEFGVHRTARVLRLNYEALKARVGSRAAESASGVKSTTFVELVAGTPAASGKCLVVFEDGRGARMWVHLEHADAALLAALADTFVRGAR